MLASLLSTRTVQDPGWTAWGAGADYTPGGNGKTAAGVSVTESSALQLLTVYGCTSFIADAISVLPSSVLRDLPGGETQEITPPAWIDEPNPDLSGPDLIGQAVASMLLDGNLYAIPVRNSVGTVLELYPLHPHDVQIRRTNAGDRPTYAVLGREFPADQILHVKAFSLPGEIVGVNPIQAARTAIGKGIALEEFASRYFSQGSNPSGVVEVPGQQSAEQVGMLREQFEAFHRGIRNSHGVAVLSGGATYRPISISPEDSQFLETHNVTNAQIAALLYRLPPELAGASLLSRSSITYQNLESQWTEIVRRALLPWISRIEWAWTHRLLPRPQRLHLDTNMYLRADTATFWAAAQIAIATGVKTKEEVRAELGLPPLPDPTATDVIDPAAVVPAVEPAVLKLPDASSSGSGTET